MSASPMALETCCALVRVFPSAERVQRSLEVKSFPPKEPLVSTTSSSPSHFSWTSPRARAKRAKENSLNVELRTKTLLLFLEHHLHVGFAHGAGDVLRPGQSLSIGGKTL